MSGIPAGMYRAPDFGAVIAVVDQDGPAWLVRGVHRGDKLDPRVLLVPRLMRGAEVAEFFARHLRRQFRQVGSAWYDEAFLEGVTEVVYAETLDDGAYLPRYWAGGKIVVEDDHEVAWRK